MCVEYKIIISYNSFAQTIIYGDSGKLNSIIFRVLLIRFNKYLH